MSTFMTQSTELNDTRRRLLDALIAVTARKGFAATTIADLAAVARVSKRSFYEEFGDKADALLALYEAAMRQALEVLRRAIEPNGDWDTQVEKALSAYFETLACNPPLLRTLFVEIMALGTRGLAVRRRATQQMADFIVGIAGGELERPHALAIVGGIHEWVLQAVETNTVKQLPSLASPASKLVRAIAGAPARQSDMRSKASSRQSATAA